MSDVNDAAAPQAVDRKELLAQQFDDVEQQAQQPVKADKADIQQPLAAVQPGERPRDANGKFMPKDATALQAAADPKPLQTQQAAPVEPPVWERPPASWKKEKHALWQAMTPEQKEYAFQREEQMRSGVEPLLPKAELADKISQAAEPYMNTIRGLGIDLPTAVSGLMKADHDLRTLPYEHKLQRLAQIARGYGIDLTGQMQTAQAAYDPNFQNIQNELLGVKGQLSSFMEQQAQAQERAALDEIQRFAKTAEHFDEVKPTMAKLLQGGLAAGIPDAYEQAIRLHPEIFDQIQAAKQAAADAEKRATANAAAQRAKAAAVSVRSATPGTTKATNAQDRRSMLAEQISGLSERL